MLKKRFIPRTMLLLVPVLLQMAIFVVLVLRFSEFFGYFYVASITISIVVVIMILNSRSNPAYKIAWIIPIMLLPIFGGVFYLLIGRNKLSNRNKKRMQLIEIKSKEVLETHHHVLEEIRKVRRGAALQASYIQNYAYYPPYQDTQTEYLHIGEIKFQRLKEELEKAQHFIFLEYYIIEEGKMWNSILNILKLKVAEGVEVRIIYDDVGCIFTLPRDYYLQLEEMGIQCCVFNPLEPILSLKGNTRDHRKIAVIDGHTGFTGGINLADEYINEIEKHGHWKDSSIMVKGKAVWNLTVMFLSMWDYLRGIDEDFNQFRNYTQNESSVMNDGFVQPFADSPLDNESVGQTVYLNLISKASKSIYITTPYLIIDYEMINALTTAAKNGVDVRIITPNHGDRWYVHSVTRSYYRQLLEGGVKIYEYTPGFIHSKNFIVDDDYGVVGTINMDYRSLYLHFECGVWLFKTESVIHMRDDFIDTLAMCEQIPLEQAISLPWYRMLGRLLLRIFAPLL
ncbi:MAG: cardiolipin synthase [Dethiosulfatibacter sp.]|nr:cardiolipin synthase [Dethiosulfatibacter sp.]